MTLRPFDLNLRHLRALPIIIACGGMGPAAEALGLSQPALTQGLAKLERQLGVALFDRRPDGMSATEAGNVVARRIAAAFEHLARALRGGRGFTKPEQLVTATQLHAYLALADAGGFVGASRETGLSQPALHRAVRDLEQVCGLVLVERRGKGVGLAPAGYRLARGARLAAAEIAAAIAETQSGAETGRIVIGAMPLSRALILPRAIARFTALSPGVRIEVVEGSWRELVDPLRDGILDLMIGALRETPPPGLLQAPLLVDHLAIVGRAGHPLAGAVAPSAPALGSFPWIIGQAGTPLRSEWESLFADNALPPAPIECGSVMVIREVLRESDFLALLSPDQVALEISSGVLAMVGPRLPASSRTIGMTQRDDWRPTPSQAQFLDLVRHISSGLKIQEN